MLTETVKHTPGPWRADWDDNGQWYIEPLGITGTKLRGDSEDCIEAANARLIAAAPEMLQALELTEQSLSGVPLAQYDIAYLMNTVRAAIKKAKGE